ncbi:hypothetical protein [Streptomyces sp. S.PB5]|uniref:hypothetical protein n=1 Tax=Streptomyces sp. S.PB5 TaxID=3020844 RepID=UPI0025B1D82D|nr:hypothetical protein [Streptomyces sp. S.PB5]MDN3027991.1 hypothetical protein [Streptomyces sp. S.PB5]
MTGKSSHVLRPVEADPGTLVLSRTTQQLGTEHWLLSTTRAPGTARQEWTDQGVALLPLGTLFAAVRLPARLVLAAADEETMPSPAVDAFLSEALDGGPVICDPHGRRYYALVRPSMLVQWQAAARPWRALGVDGLGRGTYLGVPRVDAVELNPAAWRSYWSVPMSPAGTLCDSFAVAELIANGQRSMTQEPEA